MTAPQQVAPTPQSVRLIHGAMAAGVIMFAIVAHIGLRPNASGPGNLANLMPAFLGLALAACALSIFLSTRVPRPGDEETAGSFWKRAAQPALIAWAILEGAGLLSVVFYSRTGSRAAIAVAGVSLFILVLLNPRYFEGR